MNRSRDVLPPSLQDVFHVSQFITLYVLTSWEGRRFLVQDPLGNQFMTEIGRKLSCTCLPGNHDHCVHTFYLLTRLYRIQPGNPLLLQQAYTEEDLEEIINGKNKVEPSTGKKSGARSDKKECMVEKVKEVKMENEKQERIKEVTKEWPQFEQGTVCAICYDDIENSTAIINCFECQNYFHTKCIKIWISHQRKKGNQSCPMCRAVLDKQIEGRLKQEEIFFVQYHQSHQRQCSSCGEEILVKIFKCLLCESVYLCEKCYYGWQHKSHDRFIGKMSKKSEWIVVSRSYFNMSKLDASLEYLQKYGKDGKDIKTLMGEKYDKFMEERVKPIHMIEHIVGSLLCVEKEVHKTYKKLEFEEKELFCCICRKKNIIQMRRMPCKHFIDEKCLNFLLKNKLTQCPLDKKFILPGLEGVNIQKQLN